VVIDPHPLWRGAIDEVLEREGIEVVAHAACLSESMALIEETQPDLVVVETAGADREPADWLVWLATRFPTVRTIVLSACDDRAAITVALESGASVYVVKKAHPVDIAVAVRQLATRSLFFAERRPSGREQAGRPIEVERAGLTRRERELLQLVAGGLSNQEMATRLWVTQQTVKFHLSNIYRKLGVANRTEASHYAHVNGLMSGGESAAAP